MKKLLFFLLFSIDLFGAERGFEFGKQDAAQKSNGLDAKIKSGDKKNEIPYYREDFSIDKEELSRAKWHLERNEYGLDLRDAHRKRDPYILDDKESFMVRSEKAHKNPEKEFEATEAIGGGEGKYTIETCEECTQEEYLVRGRKIKKRYVYLDKPPYITAGQTCKNHGHLTVRVEILEESDEVFNEEGTFNITHLSTVPWGGAYVDETYHVNGANIVLRKTIQQNGHPWIHPQCYLVPALQNHVVSANTLITKLLRGAEDEDIHWGEIGNAHLYHRIVNDTGDHYWILDSTCKRYEDLCDQGICRYYSVTDDPPTDKFWKGKKVNGSWGQTVTYACKGACKDTCRTLRARGCIRQPGQECLERVGDKCVHWRVKYKCQDRVGLVKHTFVKGNPFCLGGDCIDSSYESDKDMIEAMGYLSILEEARKEMDGTANINIFKGNAYSCSRFPLSFKDCCGNGRGWGVSLGLSGCDESSRVLGKLRAEGKCIRIGEYCAERTPFIRNCLRKKTVFCCFGTKFAKLLQEQGKPQLGKDFGTPQGPNCIGFTAEELSRIDFSKLDLTEIAEDVMSKFKPQKGEHFAKGGELDRIRKQVQKDIEAPAVEKRYLQENMKHLVGSMKTGGNL